MIVGENINKTKIWFENNKNFETYINSLDENGNESDDAIVTGFIYKLETPVFKFVNRSRFGKVTRFKRDIVEVIGDICYLPASKYCFINCLNFF